MTAEDSSPRTTRTSPAHQSNGHEDRTASVSRTEETRGTTQQNHKDHQNTGPALWSVRDKGSGTARLNSVEGELNFQDERLTLCVSSNKNREHQAQIQHFLCSMWYRDPGSSSTPGLSTSRELDRGPDRSYQTSDLSPISGHMTEVRAMNRERAAHMVNPRTDTVHQVASFSHVEQNGFISAPPHSMGGSYSPLPNRSKRQLKLRRMTPQSDADPDQGASSVDHDPHPVLSRAERMAALERRMMANGLCAPGRTRSRSRSRSGLGQRGLGGGGVSHMGAVQMNESLTTSGSSESSESDLEMREGRCSTPQRFGDAAETPTYIPRNKFSLGSLELGEEEDEDGCHVFTDEDSGQIFSC